MREVCIAGTGSTTFGRHSAVTPQDLAARAARAAVLEAGIARSDIGAIYVGNFVSGVLTGQEVLAGLLADHIGLAGVPATKVEGACASGGIAFRHAVMAVASGLCEAALAVGTESMTHADTATVTAALNCAMDHRSDGAAGLTYPGLFGLVWRAHAERYGTSREEVAAVSVKNKRNGLRNPLASMGADLSLDDVAQSKPIADPLALYDCCGISDGAAAVLVTTTERAKEAEGLPIRVLAAAQSSGPARISGLDNLLSFPATVQAAQRAFAESGLSPTDIDLVELHDCFSIAEIVDSEDLGVVPRGEGGRWALDGRTAVDGEMPINASGGLLAKGHPVGATGIGQIYEVVQQLRGTHPNQVKEAGIGLTHSPGGTGISCTVSILGRPDV